MSQKGGRTGIDVGGTKRQVLRNTHNTTDMLRLLRATGGRMHASATSSGTACPAHARRQHELGAPGGRSEVQ